jgi:hypothetical protein
MHISLDIHDNLANVPNFSIRSVYNNSGTDVISTLMNVNQEGTITANNYTSKTGAVSLADNATFNIPFTANKVGILNIVVASDTKARANAYSYVYTIYYDGANTRYEATTLVAGIVAGGISVTPNSGASGVTFTITNLSGGAPQLFNYSLSYINALNIN